MSIDQVIREQRLRGALLEGESDAILRKAIEKAKAGDATALRLCLERLLPARRDRLVSFDLPEINSAADALAASNSVLAACAEGTLSPDEAAKFMDLIAKHTHTLEVTEIEARFSPNTDTAEGEDPLAQAIESWRRAELEARRDHN